MVKLARAGLASALCALAALLPVHARAAAPTACRMDLIADIKVAPGRRPTFEMRVDGRPVTALIDTGAFSSVLSRAAAGRLGLLATGLPGEVTGVVGKRAMAYATLDSVEFGGGVFRHVKLLVIDSRLGGVDMIVGRDFLTPSDLEFDLAHGVVRLLRPHGCKSDEMVYWTDKPYAQAPLLRTAQRDAFSVKVALNGVKVDAMIDSGAYVSLASLSAARRAGVSLAAAPGAFGGVGEGALERRVGTVGALSVGDETVRNARLQFADLFRGSGHVAMGSLIAERADDEPDMLLGADFLMAHHVLISPSQKLVFFTYGGGVAFALDPAPVAPAAAAAPAAAPVPTPSSAPK